MRRGTRGAFRKEGPGCWREPLCMESGFQLSFPHTRRPVRLQSTAPPGSERTKPATTHLCFLSREFRGQRGTLVRCTREARGPLHTSHSSLRALTTQSRLLPQSPTLSMGVKPKLNPKPLICTSGQAAGAL